MSETVASLVAGHRAIEAALEACAQGFDAATLPRVRELLARHYRAEEAFLTRLHDHDPALAAKLRAQHDEALEIADRLAESLAAGDAGDVVYLGRRLLAIAQHNMIEEERDVFPHAPISEPDSRPDR